MSDVWVARLNRFVEKLFNVKGGPTVVDIDPSVHIEVEWQSGVEDRVTQGWNRFGAGANAGPVAAQNSAIRLRNPVGSNIVAVIERMSANTAATGSVTFQYQTTNADLGTINTPIRLDERQQSGSVLVFSSSGTGVVLNGITQANTGVTELQFIQTHNQEIALLPGAAVQIYDLRVNELLFGGFIWRERALETSELA